MAAHTEEPWGKERYDISNPFAPSIPHIFIEGGGRTIADVGLWTDLAAKQEANAARILAAVNACAGLSTEALERGVVKDLLAACGSVVKLWIPRDNGQVVILRAALDEAQAALSKAKGEG
ncbi:hypothetical protein LCGC14_0993020 [marine sediment metagenome]|uniref:Uncharacterized protein n=1 Tax=marine sediment metagenome TaxID=412755 RepID=A0A0F9N9T8_9ZZZZ